MQAVKIVALCLVCLTVALAVIGLFTPGEYEVVRQTVIQAPRDSVFAFLRMLKNQERFSAWADMDPAMERDYRGTDGTVGFVMAWRSQNEDLGSGEQEIIHIAEGERIDYELRFFEPFETTAKLYWLTEAVDSAATRVTWAFRGHLSFPRNLMLHVIDMNQKVGEDLERGLEKLKALMETHQ